MLSCTRHKSYSPKMECSICFLGEQLSSKCDAKLAEKETMTMRKMLIWCKLVCALCWHWSGLIQRLCLFTGASWVADMNVWNVLLSAWFEPRAQQMGLIQHAARYPACANGAELGALPHEASVWKVQRGSQNKRCPLSQLVWTWLKQEIDSWDCRCEWISSSPSRYLKVEDLVTHCSVAFLHWSAAACSFLARLISDRTAHRLLLLFAALQGSTSVRDQTERKY